MWALGPGSCVRPFSFASCPSLAQCGWRQILTVDLVRQCLVAVQVSVYTSSKSSAQSGTTVGLLAVSLYMGRISLFLSTPACQNCEHTRVRVVVNDLVGLNGSRFLVGSEPRRPQQKVGNRRVDDDAAIGDPSATATTHTGRQTGRWVGRFSPRPCVRSVVDVDGMGAFASGIAYAPRRRRQTARAAPPANRVVLSLQPPPRPLMRWSAVAPSCSIVAASPAFDAAISAATLACAAGSRLPHRLAG